MPTKSKNTAEVFVECLEGEGVEYIFGVPGEENLTFLEAVRKSKINFITTRSEQGAVFMAATVGRLTGKVGVALSTLGPGATNLLTGAAYAQLGGFPLLVITGQKPIKKSKQGKFQIVDIVAMMKPVTKYSATIVSSNKVSSIVREAVSLAQSERMGAVHLELPEDIAEEKCNAKPIMPKNVSMPKAKEQDIDNAIKRIEKAKHPLVIVGRGATDELRKFIEKTGIPFVSTQMGKGIVDEYSPLYIGTTALSAGDYAHLALKYADLVIVVGHDVIEKPPIILTGGNIIHISVDTAQHVSEY